MVVVLSEIEELKKVMTEAQKQFDNIEAKIYAMRLGLTDRMAKLLDEHQSTQIEPEFLKPFFDEPYVILPKKGHQWWVIVPKWLKMQVGYLEHSTKSYNIFVVSKYIQWLSEIPTVLKEKLRFPPALPFKVYDGMLLTGKEHQDSAWEKFKPFLQRREGTDRIRIKHGYEFKLIAQLIEQGTLPFVAKPVSEEDLRSWTGPGYEKYRQICQDKDLTSLQDKAWKSFLEYGNIGVFWAFGTGKSLSGHRMIGCVKGPKLVIVPTLTLKEQWLDRLNLFNPDSLNEVTVETYHAYQKVRNKQWVLTIFDECQHLPADTFIRLSTIRTKYRAGFSGSPFREDGRENYIFALTGMPLGMAWEDLLRLQIIKVPQFRLYIVQDKTSKDQKLEELLQIPLKTLVFSDSLDYGEEISRKFGIPFVYGETKDRLEIIRTSQMCVVSRVGDEGLSVPDLERVIEVAFLFGSRMQESQRFGRLMHSEKETQHIIIMTQKEFESYQKRLKAILERGFKIEYVM